MIANELIERVLQQGGVLSVEDGQLVLTGNRGVFDDDLLQEIKRNKPAIIQTIEKAEADTAAGVSQAMPAIKRQSGRGKKLLSFAQQRLWFIDRLGEGSAQYNITAYLRLTGDLNRQAFSRAIESVVQRHDVLRSRFIEENDTVYQTALESFSLNLDSVDLSDLDEEQREAEVLRLARNDANCPFDFDSEELLVRANLLRLAEREHVVLFNFHHIAADGWSMNIFMNELGALYEAFCRGSPDPLPPLAIQYADYAQWQREWLQGETLEQQLNYWQKQLNGVPPVHGLRLDHARPALQSFTGRVYPQILGRETTALLRKLCNDHDVTPFMALQTAFAACVGRYSNERDIVIGTPIAGRTHGDTEELIGFFVNTLALRTRFEPWERFVDVLTRNKQVILEAFSHEHLPFEMLVERLQPERNPQHHPLFQIMFTLQNEGTGAPRLHNLDVSPVGYEQTVNKFDLELTVLVGETLGFNWNYNVDLFDESTVERLAESYEQLLKGIVADVEQAIAELPILPPGEARQLNDWNDTSSSLPDCGAHVLFEQQAEMWPDAIALICQNTYLGYGAMNRRANQMARYLQRKGVRPESRVGVSLSRSESLVVSLLAIWKAGGAYVPLEPSYPVERLEYMIKDAGIELVIGRDVGGLSIPVIDIEMIEFDLDSRAADNPAVAVRPSNLAYVMYTSGSTGMPKGVMISHGNIARLLLNVDYMQLDADVRFLHAAPVAFDASTLELWGPLLHGGSCVLLDGEVPEAQQLASAIRDYKVDSAWLTSALFNTLVDESAGSLIGFRQLAVGGEAVSPARVRRLYELDPEVRLINGYGPTESTTFACCYPIPRDHDDPAGVPIGHAIGNTEAYVLDDHLQAVPIGVVGELYLGGKGLGRGYLDRPGLTAERFLPNPYRSGERMYRTGDLCRYRGDGELAYVGRIDHQVKVRGFRIELGEVESKLLEQSGVQEAVALVLDGDLGQQLVAYVVRDGDTGEAQLKQALQQSVPSYMVPLAIIELDGMPLTANGKLDREALPEPDWDRYRLEYVAPRDQTDQRLVDLFQGLLPVERIGIDDNFFELGGHSLLATRLISQIRREFDVEVPLRDLFDRPTVRGLVQSVEGRRDELVLPPIEKIDRDRVLPLSYAQQRVWFIDQLEGGSIQYNMPLAFLLKGDFDRRAFTRAVGTIVQRHEVLRTNYAEDSGKAHQVIHDSVELPVDHLDLSALGRNAQEEKVRRLGREEASQPFNLRLDPPLRLRLLRLAPDRHVVIGAMHHIASDGWSIGIFFHELSALYTAYEHGKADPLAPLPLQYADYAVWHRDWLQGETLRRELEYWRQQLVGIPPVHNLPLDHPRPAEQSFTGRVLTQCLGATTSSAVERFCQQYEVTPFMFLQTAFAVLLSRYGNETDIVMGTPIAGRAHGDTERMIGFFVNSLVLRTRIDEDKSFDSLLGANKQMVLDAFTHQHIPFEMLVDSLKPERTLSYSPLYQISFSLQTDNGGSFDIPGLSLSPLELGGATSIKFDLQLVVNQAPQNQQLIWTYNPDLFDRDTISRLSDGLVLLVQQVVSAPQTRLSQLDVIDDAERQRLLTESKGPVTPYPQDRYLHQWIAGELLSTPGAIALKSDDEELSYGELDRRANQLAHFLRERGVEPGARVAIFLDRCCDLFVAQLGALKAGATYVPLAPELPTERLSHILVDCAASTVLTQLGKREFLPAELSNYCLDSQELRQSLARYEGKHPPYEHDDVDIDRLAYVIYTSGSTGTPKGVPIRHRGLLNYCAHALDAYYDSHLDGSLVVTSHGFDITVPALFLPLLRGGFVELPQQGAELENLAKALSQNDGPNYLLRMTPVHAGALLAQLPEDSAYTGEHIMIIGGAQLTYDVVAALTKHFPRARLYNHYGPTETTIGCALYPIEQASGEGAVPIGKAMANTCLYVLDRNGELVPRGVAGELYVCSVGISPGYLNDELQTQGAFVPFEQPGSVGRKAYKTGDIVRRRADGLLEFVGRGDDQVKIRGHRVELGEIESQLMREPGVSGAAVLARTGDTGQQQLVAYVVPSGLTTEVTALGDSAIESLSSEYRESLSRRLPDYMIPSLFVPLEELPLTASGKVDRKALPAPDMYTAPRHEAFVAPDDETEAALCAIWQDILRIEQVGVEDNFFELGGDSIISIQMVAKARQAGLILTVRDVFLHQTVRALALNSSRADESHAEQGLVQGSVPLTPIQRRFADANYSNAHHWNMTMLFSLPATVDLESLQSALNLLIEHHDALRMYYTNGDWQTQAIAGFVASVPLRVTDLGNCSNSQLQQRLTTIANEEQSSVDLTSGCLLRACLFRLPDGSAQLLLVAHHLAVDGISWRILQEDLQFAYRQISLAKPPGLPAKSHSFKDWSEHLQKCVDDGLLDREISFWRAQVGRVKPLYRQHNGENLVRHARTCSGRLSESRTEQLLRDANGAYRTEINDLLLSALLGAYRRWASEDAVSLLLEGHGREPLGVDPDISRTVGWFTSKYPVTLRTDEDTAGRTLMAVKEQLRAVPNKGIGYGMLRHLHRDSDVRASLEPAVPVALSFNYLGQFQADASESATENGFELIQGVTGSSFSPEQQRPELMSIIASVYKGQLQVSCLFSECCYDAPRVEEFINSYLDELTALIEHCQTTGSVGRTPSDYPLCSLNQNELDQLRLDMRDEDGEQLEAIYPLSSVQEGTLFHSQSDDQAGHYVVQLGLKLARLNRQAYRRAWEQVVETHGILRTAFWRLDGEKPRQVVPVRVELPWTELDWSALAVDEQNQRWRELLLEDRRQGFDANRAPLMRFYLIATGGGQYRFLWSHHHALIDGWSSPLVIRDLLRAYHAHAAGEAVTIRPAAQFSDYIAWLLKQDIDQARAFWREHLGDVTAPTPLSFGRRGRRMAPMQGSLETVLDSGQSNDIQRFSQRHRVTLATLLQGMWALLLSRYCGEHDVMFGMTVSGRPAELPGVGEIVGPFLKTLPVRVQAAGERVVIEYLEDLQQAHLLREENGYLPLVEIQRCCKVPAGVELFETLVVYENYPSASATTTETDTEEGQLHLGGLEGNEQTHYPITVIVAHHEGRLWLRVHYDAARFDAQCMESLVDHYKRLLLAATANPSCSLAQLDMFSTSERDSLARWNDTTAALPPEHAIHHLVERQAARTPQATAVLMGEQRLTYAELNSRADQLAAWLRAQGVTTEQRVGVCLPREPLLVVALLGILKAGGAYVPLDPEYPSNRLAFMVRDSGMKLLLSSVELSVVSELATESVTVVDLPRLDLCDEEESATTAVPDADNLAYLIYTSGSTGQPKGVAMRHGGAVAMLAWAVSEFGPGRLQGVLASTSICFVYELFAPLCVGGAVVLARDALSLLGFEQWDQVSLVNTVPSAVEALVSQKRIPDSVSVVNLAGEALSRETADKVYAQSSIDCLYNLYGPSEDTTYSTGGRVPANDESMPAIGQPLSNTQAFVLDDKLQVVPIGVVGELYLSGMGLARGYLDRPGLTAERFMPNPYVGEAGARMYRTGDLCRYRQDGQLDYMGRIDHQVKVRGFRIELGEIESQLRQQAGVDAALAQVMDGDMGQQLVAYVTGADSLDEGELKRALRSALPAHMVPTAIIVMAHFPLTANGKVDRGALPEPDWERYRREYVAPRNETDKQLVGLFQRLLPVERIGIDDNFFELGGHSLLATRLISLVRQELAVELPLRTLFAQPTVRGLSAALKECDETAPMPSMVRAEETRFNEALDDALEAKNIDGADDEWEEGEL